jgi:hypothetical protein
MYPEIATTVFYFWVMDDLIWLLLVNNITVPELFTCPKIVIAVLQKRCVTVIFANEITFNNFMN